MDWPPKPAGGPTRNLGAIFALGLIMGGRRAPCHGPERGAAEPFSGAPRTCYAAKPGAPRWGQA